MSSPRLPPGHLPVEAHSHSGSKCPVTGKGHVYCPPQAGDNRSVCPALNAMANHGYINRSGKNITFISIVRGLRNCYGLTLPLSIFLATGGYALIKRIPFPFRGTSLDQFDKHAAVEHDASLVHRDCPKGEKYPPIEVVPEWVNELVGDIRPPARRKTGDGFKFEDDPVMDERDVARARVRREKLSPPLDAMHAEIARGEMAIILGVWNRPSASSSSSSPTPGSETKSGAPLEWMLDWLQYEKMPDDWKPTHKQTLRDVVARSTKMRETTKVIRDREEREGSQEY